MTLNPITIPFNQDYSNKIRVIQEAISEPTTHRKILEGLVDTGYANALRTLYVEGRISEAAFKQCLKRLPTYLQKIGDH